MRQQQGGRSSTLTEAQHSCWHGLAMAEKGLVKAIPSGRQKYGRRQSHAEQAPVKDTTAALQACSTMLYQLPPPTIPSLLPVTCLFWSGGVVTTSTTYHPAGAPSVQPAVILAPPPILQASREGSPTSNTASACWSRQHVCPCKLVCGNRLR